MFPDAHQSTLLNAVWSWTKDTPVKLLGYPEGVKNVMAAGVVRGSEIKLASTLSL